MGMAVKTISGLGFRIDGKAPLSVAVVAVRAIAALVVVSITGRQDIEIPGDGCDINLGFKILDLIIHCYGKYCCLVL